jgi:hypothetical protein
MIYTILSIAITIYVVCVAIFIIRENRSPQSTYGWLLAFVAFPVIGLLVYYFLGRGSKTFSQETRMTHEVVDGDFKRMLQSQVMDTSDIVERMSKRRDPGRLISSS